jgi:hypothetical protein
MMSCIRWKPASGVLGIAVFAFGYKGCVSKDVTSAQIDNYDENKHGA